MSNAKKINSYLKISRVAIALLMCLFLFPNNKTNAQTVLSGSILMKIGDYSKSINYSEYSNWFLFSPSLSIDSNYFSELENMDYCFNEKIICDLSITKRKRIHTKKDVAIFFEKEKARLSLEEISKEAYVDPVNAKFQMENEKVSVFVPEKDGSKVDIEESLELLSKLFKNSSEMQNDKEISLPQITLHPSVTTQDVNNLGIKTLIGTGKSNFKGSTGSRIHNIKVAMSKYNGLLLAPGDEFSFVNILGPVDGENGYLPELVIKKDKTEPEFGGGICQVSTTVFRAAIYAGLEITARKNHAYPVSYYSPQGMDATIYVPRPDLKFKNNTPGNILFQVYMDGTELIFNLYGTNDGRKVEVDGPHVLEKNSDGSMRTVFTQKVFSKNNEEIINDTFNSFYDSPSKFPHPSEEKLTKKPKDWSKNQWELYKKANGI